MERKEDFYIPEEVAEWIGLKKSEYLSKLIGNMEGDDFSFEEFFKFDDLIPGTIENPDKAFEYEEDNHHLRTYLRSYHDKEKVHQMVIGVLIIDHASKSPVFIPILTFVSRKDKLIKLFTHGKVIAGHTLN